MIGPDGKAWIIDPAAYYGHLETDIAMTKLLGGFASAFYETYFVCTDLTLTPGYKERKDLYNLFLKRKSVFEFSKEFQKITKIHNR